MGELQREATRLRLNLEGTREEADLFKAQRDAVIAKLREAQENVGATSMLE